MMPRQASSALQTFLMPINGEAMVTNYLGILLLSTSMWENTWTQWTEGDPQTKADPRTLLESSPIKVDSERMTEWLRNLRRARDQALYRPLIMNTTLSGRVLKGSRRWSGQQRIALVRPSSKRPTKYRVEIKLENCLAFQHAAFQYGNWGLQSSRNWRVYP